MSPTGYSPGSFAKKPVIVGSARPQPRRFILRPSHALGPMLTVIALLVLYLFAYEPAYDGTLVVRAPRPLILAQGEPVDGALDAGLDGVSLSSRMTGEGELLIFDDSGHGGWRFEDLVRSIKGRGLAIVELQASGPASTGIEQRAVAIIQRHDAQLSVVLGSINPLVLYRIKRIDPFVRTAFISSGTEEVPWILRQELIRRAIRKLVRFDMVSLHPGVDHATAGRLIGKGWPVVIWPDTDGDLNRALTQRPYGVVSGQPIVARRPTGE